MESEIFFSSPREGGADKLRSMSRASAEESDMSARLSPKKLKSVMAVESWHITGTPAAPASMGGMPNPSASEG